MKYKATEIIKDKFWIVSSQNGQKIGTLKADDNAVTFYPIDDQTVISMTHDEASQMFDFLTVSESSSSESENIVYGYPVKDGFRVYSTETVNNLPCFTKTKSSQTKYVAGYYGINFPNGGWMTSFCPKLSTLKKYQFVGPFKTEHDMNIAVKQLKNS